MKNKIDWENRKIYGHSGKEYKILPELLTAGRAAEFQIRGMVLGFNTDFETLLKLVHNAAKRLREGNNYGAIADTITELEQFKKGMLNYQENSRPAIVEFCSLFCIGEGENTGIHNEDIIREKYNDWREIPIQDFFLLSGQAIPYFRERLAEAVSGQTKG